MNRVSEAEILDVLLGDADPALEACVRQAVRHDPACASLYAQWNQVVPVVQAGAEPLRKMNSRVRDRVMKTLADPQQDGVVQFLDTPASLRRLSWAWLWRLHRRAVVLCVAATLLAAVGLPAAWNWFVPGMAVESVSGEVIVLRSGRDPAPIFSGERFTLPVRLQAAAGSRARLTLADHSRLILDAGSDLSVLDRRRVRQNAGTASYRVAKKWFESNFRVLIPQGSVEDLGTEFNVSIGNPEASVVRVDAGKVRVSPQNGERVVAQAGERAIISATRAQVKPVPAWTDLAEARSQFTTHIVQAMPAPQPYNSVPPPPGVHEITYPSGGLILKAWVSADPGDGRRHPAVVYFHGGYSFSQFDWNDTLPYRQAGFVVLAPMLRGENGNPGNFECFWGEVDDAVAAGRAAEALPYVDPGRVYASGFSIGGTVALLASMVPSSYAAVTPIAPIADLERLFQARRTPMPFDPKDPRERLLRSPRVFPDSLRGNVNLIFGETDNLSDAGIKLAFEAAGLGKSCRVTKVPGTHQSSLTPGIQQSLKILQTIDAGHKCTPTKKPIE